jgi:hypothetical protein
MPKRFRALGWALLAAGAVAVSVIVIVGAIGARGDNAFNRWVGWATIAALPFAAVGIVFVVLDKIDRERDHRRESAKLSAGQDNFQHVALSGCSPSPDGGLPAAAESSAHRTESLRDTLGPTQPAIALTQVSGTGEVPGFSVGSKNHIFISYARADGAEHALEIERMLRIEGFGTWRDVRDIDLSSDFTSEIESAIQSSLAVVLCVTPDISRPDSFVRREIAFAQMVNRPVIVARFANIPPPISVASHTCIDFYLSKADALGQLLRYLRQRNLSREKIPETARNSYLKSLYHEIVSRLDNAIILPVIGRRMQLLEASGMVTSVRLATSGPDVLSDRYFRPAYGPIAGAGIRQALDYSGQRLAVVGVPGVGKTITLMSLARDLASEAIMDPVKPIPLLVSAASWPGDPGGEGGLVAWLAGEVPVLAASMADLIRSQMVILLVDGLDELPARTLKSGETEEKHPRKDLITALPRSGSLVVASRPHEFQETAADMNIRAIFELKPLTDNQVANFVAEFPDVTAVLQQDNELRASARTPLMLSLLCSALDAAKRKELGHLTLPEARDLIIGSYVESRYERECRRSKDTGSTPPSLEELYRGLGSIAMSDAGGGGNRNLFSEDQILGELDVNALSYLLNMNIMIVTLSRVFRFYHLAFRDHFAFRYAQIAINDSDPDTRDSAAWALWQIPDRRVVDLLLGALSDPYPYARGSAASALGQIGDHRAVEPLKQLLSDQTPVASMYGDSIGEVAAWAIRRIVSQQTTT